MRRTVLILPSLLSMPNGDSYLRQNLPSLAALTEMGEISRVSEIPASETPEAFVLGMGTRIVELQQGPLTVSALGFDPPERSTHFHLSLMSLIDGVASIPSVKPLPADLDILMTAAKRLDTKLLTVLRGEQLDHALVWEALGDIGTTSAIQVHGKAIKGHRPEGDGETTLRRFVDDSINLLSELELHERRIDEGLPPFNLLWPWGQGVRTTVPNLALRRGEPAVVESSSMRLAGLTRLAGYKHGDREKLGTGLATKLRSLADRMLSKTVSIAYLDVADGLRQGNKAEEIDWFIRELDRELIKPILSDHLKTPSRFTLISPGPSL